MNRIQINIDKLPGKPSMLVSSLMIDGISYLEQTSAFPKNVEIADISKILGLIDRKVTEVLESKGMSEDEEGEDL